VLNDLRADLTCMFDVCQSLADKEAVRYNERDLIGHRRENATMRVAGSLMVTRALGDGYLKRKDLSMPPFQQHVPYITVKPKVTKIELDSSHAFLVIASDGIWDHLRSLLYTHAHTRSHAHTHLHAHAHTHAHCNTTHTQMHPALKNTKARAHTHTHASTRMQPHQHTQTHTYVHKHNHTHTHPHCVCMCVWVCVCISGLYPSSPTPLLTFFFKSLSNFLIFSLARSRLVCACVRVRIFLCA